MTDSNAPMESAHRPTRRLALVAAAAAVLSALAPGTASAVTKQVWAVKPISFQRGALVSLRARGVNVIVANRLTRGQRARVRAARLQVVSTRSGRGRRVVALRSPKGVLRVKRPGRNRVLALVRLTIDFDSRAWTAAVRRAANVAWLDLGVLPRGERRTRALNAYLVVMNRVRDRAAPTMPSALALSERRQLSVRLAWKASRDNRGVAQYGLYRNGRRVGATARTSAVFGGLTCGRTYRLGVNARDRAGNSSRQAQINAVTLSCAPGDGPPPPPGPPPAPPGLGGALPAPLPQSAGATFYVAPNGSDANPGSQAAPWATIQKAENTLAAGQKALVRAGTYAPIYVDRNGSPLAPISIQAYPGERPVIHAPEGGGYAVEIVGSYFRVSGFVLENARNTNIYLENPSHHVEVSRNEILGSDDQGIYVEGNTHDHQILANHIHNNGLGLVHQSHGIYLEGARHLVANNVIHDQPKGFGIQVYPENDGSFVVGNTVVASGYAGIVLGGGGGVRNVVVRNNVFANNSQHGIAHDSVCATATIVDHNVLFGNGSGAIEGGCGGVDRSAGNRTTDPLLVNLAARNLHLRGGSAAIDYGVLNYSPVFDFDGLLRSYGAAPDAGAYERP
jgi:hypothetical protein